MAVYVMRLYEQNNGKIVLDGTMRELPMLTAWKNSSAVYWVIPEYPASEMYMKVGAPDGKSWATTVKMHCHPKRGMFRAYISGRNFAGGRYETKYQVITIDEEGARHISGEGILRVFDNGFLSLAVYSCQLSAFGGPCRGTTGAEAEGRQTKARAYAPPTLRRANSPQRPPVAQLSVTHCHLIS